MTASTWVTLVVGLLATTGVLGTMWQRQHSESADRFHRLEHEARVEWWRRFQWAAEQSLTDNPGQRDFGIAIIDGLASSPLITPSETGLLDAVGILQLHRPDECDRSDEA